MLTMDEIRIDTYFDSAIMPYGMKVTHLPTGITLAGNCKNENSQNTLQRQLLDALALAVQTQAKEGPRHDDSLQAENEMLHRQLAAMQEQIRELARMQSRADMRPDSVPKPAVPVSPAATVAVPKLGGRGKYPRSEETKAKIAATLRARKAAAKEPSLDTLIKEQMRPPTDVPVPLPKAHQSRGRTVAKTHVNYIKE